MEKILYKSAFKCLLLASASLFIGMLQSCKDDDLMDTTTPDGLPATISLSMTVPTTQTVTVQNTRAAEDVESEVKKLFLVMYSAAGRIEMLELSSYITSGLVGGDNSGYREYTITAQEIKTLSGDYEVYAIANPTSNFCQLSNESIQVSKKQLEELLANCAEGAINISDDNRIPMFGQLTQGDPQDPNSSKIVSIQPGTSSLILKGNLKRLMSRIEFHFVSGKTADGKDISFTPASYRVYNVPKHAYLKGRENKSDNKLHSEETEYNDDEFFHVKTPITIVEDNEFSFLMLENIQDPGTATTFAERESWDDSGFTKPEDDSPGVSIDPENKKFLCAPKYATYVVVNGAYEDETYRGTVSYTIHLGDFSSKTSEAYKNFTVNRNEIHKYRITVNGVSSITTEANIQDLGAGTAPGAEGTLFKAANNFVLDAHYEALLISMTKEQLEGIKEKWENGKSMLSISSPYNNFVYTSYPQGDEMVNGELIKGNNWLENNEIDYTWIQIMKPIQRDEKDIVELPRFPGYVIDNNGDYVMDPKYEDRIQLPTKYPKDESGVYGTSHEYGEGKEVKIGYLTDFCSDPFAFCYTDDKEPGKYYFAIFVDEYVYGKHNPKNQFLSVEKWVNTANRTLILNPTNINVSPDNQSTVYDDFAFSIAQRSIKTTYDLNELTNENGMYTSVFGLETWDETSLNGSIIGTSIFTAITNLSEQERTITVKKSGNTTETITLDTYNQTATKDPYHPMYGRANTVVLHRESGNKTPNDFWKYAGYNNTVITNNKRDHTWNYPSASATQPGTNAIQAVMMRNRDLNGNGKIDDSEIKWYLPAIAQFYTVWLGRTAIPGDTRLMDPSVLNSSGYINQMNKLPKFFCSTGGNSAVYWQDQGICISARSDLYTSWFSQYHYTRAARNIPDYEIATEFPVDATYQDRNVLCVRGIDKQFLRNYTWTKGYYDFHTERDDLNNIPPAFEVSTGTYTIEKEYWGKFNAKDKTPAEMNSNLEEIFKHIEANLNNNDKQKTGWRIPNQRELMLLFRYGYLNSSEDKGDTFYTCCTWFTHHNTDRSYPFSEIKNRLILDKGFYGTLKVRLVRDVDINNYPPLK